MRPEPCDFNGLAAFFDPASVAAAVRDVLDVPPSEPCSRRPGNTCMSARAAAVHDRQVLDRLLPREVYDYWRQAGYAGLYAMTFMLRHALCFLSLAMHERACSDPGPRHAREKYYAASSLPGPAECLAILTGHPFHGTGLPLVGFSALGVHFSFRQSGSCRAFDAYDISCCSELGEGLFCRKHRREAWWEHEGPGASAQADMYRFYARWQNLYAYGEHELEAIVRKFWSRMANYRRSLRAPDPQVSEALAFFGYATFAELCSCGQVKLRRRYAERAREMHPDLGGDHDAFLGLRKQYEVLRDRLSFECAQPEKSSASSIALDSI